MNSQPGGQGAVEVWFFRRGDDLVVESQIPQGADELAGSEDKIEKRDRESDGRDDEFDTGGAEFSDMDDIEFERSEQEQSSDDQQDQTRNNQNQTGILQVRILGDLVVGVLMESVNFLQRHLRDIIALMTMGASDFFDALSTVNATLFHVLSLCFGLLGESSVGSVKGSINDSVELFVGVGLVDRLVENFVDHVADDGSHISRTFENRAEEVVSLLGIGLVEVENRTGIVGTLGFIGDRGGGSISQSLDVGILIGRSSEREIGSVLGKLGRILSVGEELVEGESSLVDIGIGLLEEGEGRTLGDNFGIFGLGSSGIVETMVERGSESIVNEVSGTGSGGNGSEADTIGNHGGAILMIMLDGISFIKLVLSGEETFVVPFLQVLEDVLGTFGVPFDSRDKASGSSGITDTGILQHGDEHVFGGVPAEGNSIEIAGVRISLVFEDSREISLDSSGDIHHLEDVFRNVIGNLGVSGFRSNIGFGIFTGLASTGLFPDLRVENQGLSGLGIRKRKILLSFEHTFFGSKIGLVEVSILFQFLGEVTHIKSGISGVVSGNMITIAGSNGRSVSGIENILDILEDVAIRTMIGSGNRDVRISLVEFGNQILGIVILTIGVALAGVFFGSGLKIRFLIVVPPDDFDLLIRIDGTFVSGIVATDQAERRDGGQGNDKQLFVS